jgi:hypothetical protein
MGPTPFEEPSVESYLDEGGVQLSLIFINIFDN